MKGSDRINAILPDELMIEIFRRLNSKEDQKASSLACKRWLTLVGQSIEKIYVEEPFSCATDTQIQLRRRRFVNVLDISINEAFGFDRDPLGPKNYFLSDSGLDAIGDGFIKLESLYLCKCPYVTCAGIISIAKKCKMLKSLNLEECHIGDEGAAAIGKYCTRLETLSLMGCNNLTDSGLIQLALRLGRTLKSLCLANCDSLTDFSLEAVGLHCVYLETLSLAFINNGGLLSIAKGCPLLKSLKLKGINVTDKSLCAIGKGCKKLKNLILWVCHSFTELGLNSIVVGCPELERLAIRRCNNIGTGALISIRKACFHLSELEFQLERFQKLESNVRGQIAFWWESLQSLCLRGSGNNALRFLTMGCKNLKKLDINGCSKVHDEGIISVARYCKFLIDLDLGFCRRVGDAGITAIAGDCPQLSYLNINGLEMLEDEGLAALGKGCRLIKKLIMRGSTRITDVGLCCIARNCKLLESCEVIDCPGITETGVTILIAGCWKLKTLTVNHRTISSRTRRRVPGHLTLHTYYP